MTNKFDTALADSAEKFTDMFGETVTYYPAAGGSREITAVVVRPGDEPLPGTPHGVSENLMVTVENSAVTGISSDEVNTTQDKIELPVRLGNAAEKRLVIDILSQDAGMMELELR